MSTNEPPAGPPPEQPQGPTPPPPPAGGGQGVPPPPPPGGYTTPPQPGGGYPTPSPAAAAYGAPPPGGYGAPAGYGIGDALSYGWSKFQANAGQILIAAVIMVVALGLIGGIGFGISAALTSDPECTYDATTGLLTGCDAGTGFFAGMLVSALVAALIFIVGQVVAAGIIRGALGITEGRPFRWQEITRTDKIGPVVVASLIVSALTFVGLVLCYLPGLVVGFMTSYTLYFVIDKDMSPVEAIKASFSFTKDHLGQTLLWYVVGGLVMSVGLAICLVGGLVTVPLVLIGTAYTYKKLTGQPVAA